MNDNKVKVGNKVIRDISDVGHNILIVKLIEGENAVCVSTVNDTEEIIPLSNLRRVTDDED